VQRAPIVKTIPFSWVDGPGNRFVIFTQGCNFNCIACHNPQTIPLHTSRAVDRDVESLLKEIREVTPFISGVTVSGGEATLHDDFILELFTKMHGDPVLETLTRYIDSNGNASLETWEKLIQVTDGVMLDLKVLDNDKHIALTGDTNKLVLESIEFLARNHSLHEVRLLLIPGINDSDEELEKTAKWLMAIDPEMQVRINAFKTHGVRASAKHWQEVTDLDLRRYLRLLTKHGIKNLVTTKS